ncbi:hypothetical protein V8F06_004558 [Rhypophila decipiens]
MRPPRIAILVLFFSASLFLLCRSLTSVRRSTTLVTPLTPPKRSFRGWLSFGSPFTLFPANAAISLTDDNSTSFPARPAAFGPPLPAGGLSGQLWVGSGFGEDSLQEGEGEGELGCSDVPGWEDRKSETLTKTAEQLAAGENSPSLGGKSTNSKRDIGKGPAANGNPVSESQSPAEVVHADDGTDDYLHRGLQRAQDSFSESSTTGSNHADIQSIQETAEITGKVALLSRGGCGFLEKVKWAQRRGAVALIVGDNQRGGPLIQMYAHGNVQNVTIPSVFTSRTTAHILSSLMQPGSFIEDILDDKGHPILKVQQSGKPRKNKKPVETATPSSQMGNMDTKPNFPKMGDSQNRAKSAPEKSHSTRRGWFSRLFNWGGGDGSISDRSRPPSSGRLDWVLVEDWSDEKDKLIKTGLDKASKGNKGGAAGDSGKFPVGDSFQIGVEDWRDPDLVGSPTNTKGVAGEGGKATDGEVQPSIPGAAVKQANGPKGGSITPGSGEYAPGVGVTSKATGPGTGEGGSGAAGGLMSKIFGDDDDADSTRDQVAATISQTPTATPFSAASGSGPGDREGLWITITPTSSASPFFDTLLVLVVSPLITLTVVYALLILRAKIRRRRWRAPKSVVERLPVRTYHTVAPSPSASSKDPSPTSSSPTTPLLQGSSRSRPRSRTTTGVPDSNDLLRVDGALESSRSPSHEKNGPHTSSQWKKYMGRQVECVVCLEEYVDGVSKVMSLPCGHEFHVECITPWLTTRRRTCPICKGDVVRSLARGSPSSPRYEPYHDDSDEDVPEASGSGSGRQRTPDVEQGIFSTVPQRGYSGSSTAWYNLFSNRLSGGGPAVTTIHHQVIDQQREIDRRR